MAGNTLPKESDRFAQEKYESRIDRARELFLELAQQDVRQAPFLCRAFLALEQALSFAFMYEIERVDPFIQLAREELTMAEVFSRADLEGGSEDAQTAHQVLSPIMLRLCDAMLALQRFMDSQDRTFLFDARQLLQSALFELAKRELKAA
jgi:hypothetical protein